MIIPIKKCVNNNKIISINNNHNNNNQKKNKERKGEWNRITWEKNERIVLTSNNIVRDNC